MKKILIVGNQGYLGSRLTEYLNKLGYLCNGIDTGFFETGKLKIPESVDTVNKDARFINEEDIEGFDVLI